MEEFKLPAINNTILPSLNNITEVLHVPRCVLADEEQIMYAWNDLPRELKKIPVELRDELIARMCIAISAGLFDGAINYVWNASIKNLRKKVSDFGINVVAQMLKEEFTESKLNELRDSELLTLCLKLNLISEEGFYFLNQCRDIRNNFSAAHPSIGFIDDRELVVFISRCAKYALSTTVNPRGVNINDFIRAVNGDEFTDAQLDTWCERLDKTHDAQRSILFEMLHGIYCDPSSDERARVNALMICEKFSKFFTSEINSILLKRHYDYQAKGDDKRHLSSRTFFEKLNMLNLLNDAEFHSIISEACKNLYNTHLDYYNFYNEPPFAKRLYELSEDNEIPITAKEEYVITVLTCYVGNRYGVSNAALPYYKNMIRDFSPKEIEIMINSIESKTILAQRVKDFGNCSHRYLNSLKLINENSVPETSKRNYEILIRKAN